MGVMGNCYGLYFGNLIYMKNKIVPFIFVISTALTNLSFGRREYIPGFLHVTSVIDAVHILAGPSPYDDAVRVIRHGSLPHDPHDIKVAITHYASGYDKDVSCQEGEINLEYSKKFH